MSGCTNRQIVSIAWGPARAGPLFLCAVDSLFSFKYLWGEHRVVEDVLGLAFSLETTNQVSCLAPSGYETPSLPDFGLWFEGRLGFGFGLGLGFYNFFRYGFCLLLFGFLRRSFF